MFRGISIEKKEGDSLKEEVYNLLKELILVNEFLPGQKLSIEELARELDISPTPIREALSKLESDGLIELSRNKRPKVTQITENDVHETYEVRRFLEPQVAKEATKNLPPDPLRNLKERMVKFSSSDQKSTSQVFHELDLELNKLIFQTVDNDFLNELLSVIKNRSVRIRFLAESVQHREKDKFIEKGNEEHLSIIEAMENKDEPRVEEAVQLHLGNAEGRTLKIINELNSQKRETINIKKYL
ncbi:GntR family transcriptional regulator [Candidatus Bipolaricaulota bacterium]|nr:GntR family transcriptional regulator [Candidatus Bipolaricaulota bacterium]MBS3792107.1 GntR family transcriptional regulator [Candidatus Bipolaricaulota bacterium]